MTKTLDATLAWLGLLNTVQRDGALVAPRGLKTRELLGYQTSFDLNCPIVKVKERELGYRFMPAEAAWILSGDNRVETIVPYSKEIARFSDDGFFFFGAYGPRIVDQLEYVVTALLRDPWTRQAVINVWRENPPASKDVPCTLSVQFLLRNGLLHSAVTMRSSDAWLGVPYDWFNQATLAGYVLAHYLHRGGKEAHGLGTGYWTAGSQHLYERNFAAAKTIVETVDIDRLDYLCPGLTWSPHRAWERPYKLVDHLWALARRDEESVRRTCDLGLVELLDA